MPSCAAWWKTSLKSIDWDFFNAAYSKIYNFFLNLAQLRDFKSELCHNEKSSHHLKPYAQISLGWLYYERKPSGN